eukprot:4188776-Prorocentrum_lima.AAC.1
MNDLDEVKEEVEGEVVQDEVAGVAVVVVEEPKMILHLPLPLRNVRARWYYKMRRMTSQKTIETTSML